MLEKILLWGIGAVVLALIGLVFLIKAKKQIKNLNKNKK